MKERSKQIPVSSGRLEQGGSMVNRSVGCMAVGLLCLLLSLPFWPVPAALPGGDAQAARPIKSQMREIREFAVRRREGRGEWRTKDAGGGRSIPKECAGGGNGAFAFRSAVGAPPFCKVDCVALRREALEFVRPAAAADALGALFLLRHATRSRMRRAACSATGL